ncbi:hypothetical protein MPTK1_4g02530 [Marchantia polymorpha subsp. ruderalis]|uniref:Uncharacterized protein n=2 Tax=Marchantia polymorpha TaxID=3197 RepID=A0AAF6B5J2_MARPO|nr:hypothetical protein MARPO_0080s0046 [Marchantia polymorpha]BBN07276.1 hypothetical protein Mp_4g02530 [Marchantia polymorpha subsp. ruderalis]|eukprot:PTQ34428.1 hypothetical protein MARPO_0080s0046 [Marchantia polymorpha]
MLIDHCHLPSHTMASIRFPADRSSDLTVLRDAVTFQRTSNFRLSMFDSFPMIASCQRLTVDWAGQTGFELRTKCHSEC